tara:strand:+ start:2555 stop:2833 length:279 start_codon:yes stop_codon:yes gene_type:complete
MRVAPSLCQTYKGLTASDLYDRYHGEGGQARLELDLAVASEISDQVQEHIDKGKGKRDAKGAIARRNQQRAARQEVSDDEALKLLKDGGFIA